MPITHESDWSSFILFEKDIYVKLEDSNSLSTNAEKTQTLQIVIEEVDCDWLTFTEWLHSTTEKKICISCAPRDSTNHSTPMHVYMWPYCK